MSIANPRESAVSRKVGFANRAIRFAKRAATAPVAVMMSVIAAATIILATVSGPFATDQLPVLPRLLLWLVMIGGLHLFWLVWIEWRVRKPDDWKIAGPLGGIMTAFLVPPLLWLAGHLIGEPPDFDLLTVWLQAFAIGVTILLVTTGIHALRRRSEARAPKGPLFRAGFHPDHVASITSEDHYVRLVGHDGRERMVHGRYSDFVAEVADADGLEIRRGLWVAANALAGTRREGRKLYLILKDDRRITASASGRSRMKEAGWI